MTKRTLLIALTVAALALVAFGAAVGPASAEQRTLLVTLVGGGQVTVTVDVAPGTPVDQIPLPGITTPVLSVQDVTPPAAPPADGPAPAPTPAEPATTTPSAPPATPSVDAPQVDAQQQAQDTTGKATRKARPRVQGSSADAGRQPDGTPTPANPSFSLAIPGPAPIGVPNFFIDKFRIPPFLLPIYQAAGIEYGVRWEVLAAINEIETDYGRNLNVSTAGAVGWMQFLPSTWERYGVDANHDGHKDPFNPVDAIFAAARYLKAAQADTDLRAAIFAYNHADWYVDSVLLRARLIGGLPSDLIGALTGLTQGHFPVHAKARYADDLSEREAKQRVKGRNAAVPVVSRADRRGINVYAKAGSPVVAVQDGKVVRIGRSPRLGLFLQLRDAYGNTYTYAQLKKVADVYPVPKPRKVTAAQVRKELHLPKRDPKPSAPATAGRQAQAKAKAAKAKAAPRATKERLFANPARPAAYRAGGGDQLLEQGTELAGSTSFKSYFTQVFGLGRSDVVLKKLKPGSRVIAGTILGRIGHTEQRMAPHLLFEVRPAGRGAPRVDPKPILDGWKLLESTAVYRAAGQNPFFGPDADSPTVGQILLMSKEALQRRVLADPRIDLYACGRRDIQAGLIDRRVLATLEFLAVSGLKPTVSALECGHSYLTASGNVSEHSSGNAVDIAEINGVPILGHQGPGSIADETIRRLLTLQGTMKPHQIISLMTYDGADNTFAMGDHADHIHVGFQPLFGTNPELGRQLNAILKPGQWTRLVDRLGAIENPTVRTTPSKYSIDVKRSKRASAAHVGE
jgi:murein DD-endopeptidase MepM/ murein hydrolase activator NlpD